MRRTVMLSRMLMRIVIVLAAVLLLLIYPVRIFRKTLTVAPEESAMVLSSEAIVSKRSLRQVFYPQYDRLEAIDVYVTELDAGRYLSFSMYNEEENTVVQRYVDLGETALPAFVRVPLGIDVKVNERYVILLQNRTSTYHVGTAFAGTSEAPFLQGMFYNWDPAPGMQLQMTVHYDLPISKTLSLALMALVVLCAAALCYGIRKFFAAHPDKDKLLLAGRVRGYLWTAVLSAFYLVLFLMNFPGRVFDTRPAELIFYAVGILLAAAVSLLTVRRLCFEDVTLLPEDGTDARGKEQNAPLTLREWLIAVLLALALQFTCNYVNGVYDAMHDAARRGMLLCFAGIFVIAATMTHPLTRLKDAWKRISWYGWMSLLTAVVLLLFRNGRTWIVWLAVIYALLYYFVAPLCRDGRWFFVVRNGAMIHFLGMTVYCLLFRAYQAYGYTRYPMIFSTATTTGEYLSEMCAIAAVLLLDRLRRTEGKTFFRRIKDAWVYAVLFGVVTSYTVFTISRIGYVTVAMTLLLLLVLASVEKEHIIRGVRRAGSAVLMMLLSLAILFPAVFTMQRMLPALMGRHHVNTGDEERSTQPMVLGRTDPGSDFYIDIELFASLFLQRILGSDGLWRFYPYDERNNYYDDWSVRYLYNGTELEESTFYPPGMPGVGIDWDAYFEEEEKESLPLEGKVDAPEAQTDEVLSDEGPQPAEPSFDLSNGRTAIWRSYIAELNLTGHATMYGEQTLGMHAHNAYLQTAFDFGVPAGVLFFLWIAVTILTGCVHYIRNGKTVQDLYVCGVAIAFAIIGLGEWSFHLGNPVTLLFLCGIAPLMTRRKVPADDTHSTTGS